MYLRSVHDIKISTEDIKDLVTFPNQPKYQREALTLQTQRIFSYYTQNQT